MLKQNRSSTIFCFLWHSECIYVMKILNSWLIKGRNIFLSQQVIIRHLSRYFDCIAHLNPNVNTEVVYYDRFEVTIPINLKVTIRFRKKFFMFCSFLTRTKKYFKKLRKNWPPWNKRKLPSKVAHNPNWPTIFSPDSFTVWHFLIFEIVKHSRIKKYPPDSTSLSTFRLIALCGTVLI